MKVDFQKIEENGIGKIFAMLENEDMPVGQLFYKVDNDNKNIMVDYIYIPRKYWREGGIREQLISEVQRLYPSYSINMKENQKVTHLLKEAPARSKAQFRYMQGICNGSIEPPKGITRAKACEYVEGQKNYKNLPEKKSARPRIREQLGVNFTRDLVGDYVAGLSLNEISKKYNISPLAIRRVLTDNQIPVRPRGGGHTKHHPRKRENKDVVFPIKKEKEKSKGNWKEKRLMSPKDAPISSKDLKLHYKYDFDFDSLPEEVKQEIEERKMLEELGEAPYIPTGGEGSGNQYQGDFIPLSDSIFQDKKMRLRPKNQRRMEYIAKWKKLNKYTHFNAKGEPCSCTFYRPELNWRRVEAAKIDLLTGDKMPKVLKTDEGQEVLRWIKTLPEKVDDLLPWMVREYKKRRLVPKMDNDGFVMGMMMPENEEEVFDDGLLSHIADWFESKSPTRRGVDIMQLSAEDLIGKMDEWNRELASQGLKDNESEEEANIVYRWPDDWVMRDITPEECQYEGSEMGHCVGGGNYARGIQEGRIKILSLRDASNKPHATIEVENDGSIVQIQGKQNIHPIGKYRKRIRQFMMDPNGFEKLMGTKPFQPTTGRGIQNWEEFLQLPEEERQEMLPSMLEINEEDEFSPEWDVVTSPYDVPEGHPAGPGGYNMNYRPKHYGIYPPLQQNQTLDIGRLLSTLPAENTEENLRRLYEFSKRKNQLGRFPSEMQFSRQRLERNFTEYIPNYEDEGRGGWKDVFERLYGVSPATTPEEEQEYKEKWNNWVSSLWSEDPATFANNLVKINTMKFEMVGNRPRTEEEKKDEIQSLYKILSRINGLSLLRNMFAEEEYPKPEISADRFQETNEYEADHYLTPREYFERAFQKGAPTPLPIEQPKDQMALFSKWQPIKKKIAMPKNPEELTEDEIITDDFVKNTRLRALEFGFKKGFIKGWDDGVRTTQRSMGDSYNIENKWQKNRNIDKNQTVIPTTFNEIPEHRIEALVDDARKNLNDVIDIVPSNFLKGGRKYTPSGKQFSKKKFIETLINDFKLMVKKGYELGFGNSREKAYSAQEIKTNFRHGPNIESIYRESYKYVQPLLSEKLKEIDAETFAYSEERKKVFDEADWEKIHKREVLDSEYNTYKKMWYPTPEKYKESEKNNWSYRNMADLKKLQELLKERENKDR